MDWVHCNCCFTQPSKADGKVFLLTNCGHLVCAECYPQGARDNCKVCNFKCTTITLSNNMKPEVAMYFSDPYDQIQKHLKQILQVMNFQNGHRRKLNEWRHKTMRELNERSDKFNQVANRMNELESENQMLKQEKNYLLKNILSHSPYAMAMKRSQTPTTQDRQLGAPIMFQTPCGSIVSESLHSNTPTNNRRLCIHSPPVDGQLGVVPGSASSSSSSLMSTEDFNLTPMMRSQIKTPTSVSQRYVVTNNSSQMSHSSSVVGNRYGGGVPSKSNPNYPLSLYNKPNGEGETPRSQSGNNVTPSSQRQFRLNYPLRPDLRSYLSSQ